MFRYVIVAWEYGLQRIRELYFVKQYDAPVELELCPLRLFTGALGAFCGGRRVDVGGLMVLGPSLGTETFDLRFFSYVRCVLARLLTNYTLFTIICGCDLFNFNTGFRDLWGLVDLVLGTSVSGRRFNYFGR